MERKVRLGILRETKNPPDRRVPLSPPQVVELMERFPDVKVCVQPSDIRGFADEEYDYLKLDLTEEMKPCDILVGVKEVDYNTFIEGKTYMFFSHVGKKQPHNRTMLQRAMEKKITLIDYEYLTDFQGRRIVAFGRWAGIVGAYNGLRARGISTNSFELKPAHQCRDMEEMYAGLKKIELKPKKIIITGGGRVAMGAMETMRQLNIREVTHEEFLTQEFDEPVLCRLDPEYYVRHRGNKNGFDYKHFFAHPDEYENIFTPYTKVADIYIAAHFWDPQSPELISREDMQSPDFNISVIADVSCDVGGPIASTIRSSTIADPFYDYNPKTGKEEPAFSSKDNVTVMAVDNLPGELPRNASVDFGDGLINNVFPHLFGHDDLDIIKRATILKEGALTEKFAYLADYAAGKE